MLNLNEIFTYTDEKHALTETEEAEAIRAAQAGDESAQERLLLAYGRTIRAAVFRFARGVRNGGDPYEGDLGMGTSAFGEDDAKSAALVGFLECIQDHDPERNPRLAGRARVCVSRALADLFEETMPFYVPERSLSRFYGILQEADGDVDLALEIAPTKSMKRETFRSILAMVRGTGSLEERESGDHQGHQDGEGTYGPGWGETSFYDDGREVFADVEDRVLVEAAFQAVDDEEARIVELRYGFRSTEDYAHGEEIPDGEIAKIVGLTRPTVQRKRGGAIEKMRKAIGALPEDDWKE